MRSSGEAIEEWSDERWANLLEAYCRTDYHVASPVSPLMFHVGELCSEQNLSLMQAGVFSWCVVTAWNPHSERRSAKENDLAQAILKADINAVDLKWWEAAGRDPAREWPSEESCFVLNISPQQARSLCREFEQLAVLYGDAEHEPWLLFGDWERVRETIARVSKSGLLSPLVFEQLQGVIAENEDLNAIR